MKPRRKKRKRRHATDHCGPSSRARKNSAGRERKLAACLSRAWTLSGGHVAALRKLSAGGRNPAAAGCGNVFRGWRGIVFGAGDGAALLPGVARQKTIDVRPERGRNPGGGAHTGRIRSCAGAAAVQLGDRQKRRIAAADVEPPQARGNAGIYFSAKMLRWWSAWPAMMNAIARTETSLPLA